MTLGTDSSRTGGGRRQVWRQLPQHKVLTDELGSSSAFVVCDCKELIGESISCVSGREGDIRGRGCWEEDVCYVGEGRGWGGRTPHNGRPGSCRFPTLLLSKK